MKTEDIKTCATCRHWHGRERDGICEYGECRLNPPHLSTEVAQEGKFPLSLALQAACGRHQL